MYGAVFTIQQFIFFGSKLLKDVFVPLIGHKYYFYRYFKDRTKSYNSHIWRVELEPMLKKRRIDMLMSNIPQDMCKNITAIKLSEDGSNEILHILIFIQIDR